MPTFETLPRFTTDLQHLTPAQRRAFRQAVIAFVDGLRTGGPFRASLRIKGVRRASGGYELTWSMGTSPAGRATWQYGAALRPNTPHVI
ncbi:hypothetical protein ABT096_32585 [Streptomyces sp. NPDC002561]|uniref:hypothetical protein n=1 Tax=Streptomyces sp. NPDC002561 TaxID=3154418 RepID=UPI0033231F10